MKVVYMSSTGNVRAFINKLGTENVLELKTGDETVDEDFIIITHSPDGGEIPYEVEDFLDAHEEYVKGVAASGDRAYGEDYTLVAETIAEQYNIPIVSRFEFMGTDDDVQKVKEFIS